MGLSIGYGIAEFLKEGLKLSFKGKSLLMLGKQDIYMTLNQLLWYVDRLHYELEDCEIKIDPLTNRIDAYSFFHLLGFENVHALDISSYEEADIVFDLNDNDLPKELENKFDYIVDGGTLEHCFDVPAALRNITKMLKVRGKIFHYVPANNYIDHGFYSFSPTLFFDYYDSNHFFIEKLSLLLSDKSYVTNMMNEGLIEDLDWCLETGIDCRLMNIFNGKFVSNGSNNIIVCCIAEKKENSTFNKVPIQRYWYEGFSQEGFKEKRKLIGRSLNKIMNKFNILNYPECSIALWGTGTVAGEIIDLLKRFENGSIDRIAGLLDGKKEELIGNEIYGINVLDHKKIEIYGLRAIIIASIEYEQEIYNEIKYLKEKGICIMRLIS